MEISRCFDIIYYQSINFPQEKALVNKVNGKWKALSTKEVVDKVNQISFGLLKQGVTKGDKVAIVSFNRYEWNLMDLGIQQIGAVSVPMYPTITTEDYKYIFKDADVKMVFVADRDLYGKVKEATSELDEVKVIYSFNRIEGAPYWEDLLIDGSDSDFRKLEVIKAGIKAKDLLTLIYTSGTTGLPKGVMLSHNNLVSNVKACHPLLPVGKGDRALSFLPLCHVYERMQVYLYMFSGIGVYYAENLETIADNLKEVKPHIFTTVPRLLEKVYEKIYSKGLDLKGIKRALFFWALNLGLKYDLGVKFSWLYNAQLKLANKLIFNKWRDALGGEIKAVVSGSAALQTRLARVFWAAQIPVMEGYGLTETSPVISVNRCDPNNNKIGTVGQLIEGVEVKIAEDGEICTKGPHVMMGYYNKPEETASMIDEGGWLHTGDIGCFVDEKYLKITGRKKEIFKTSGGKYIAPELMENKFKESMVIEQIMVVGEGEKFPGALIVPSFTSLKEWSDIHSLKYTTDEEMIKNEDVINKFQKEVNIYNENFAQYEKIKRFVLLPRLFTIEGGELTPTMKMKRKIIMEKYKREVEEIYKA